MGHVFEYVSHIEATIELQQSNVVFSEVGYLQSAACLR